MTRVDFTVATGSSKGPGPLAVAPSTVSQEAPHPYQPRLPLFALLPFAQLELEGPWHRTSWHMMFVHGAAGQKRRKR